MAALTSSHEPVSTPGPDEPTFTLPDLPTLESVLDRVPDTSRRSARPLPPPDPEGCPASHQVPSDQDSPDVGASESDGPTEVGSVRRWFRGFGVTD